MDIVKLWGALAAVLLLSGCGGGGEEEAKVDPVATVRTAVASSGASASEVTVYGMAEAGPGSDHALTVQAEGVVARIVAPTGTPVSRGQVIAVLRPSATARADAAKAASDAAAADAAYARARRLRGDGLVSDAEVETARAAARAADAARAASGARLGTLSLRAPAAGTVQNLTARPGDLVAAGTAVAVVAGAGTDLRARFGVDPAVAATLHPGQPIRIVPVGSARTIEASVSGIDLQPDATTRQVALYARVPGGSGVSAGAALRGMIAGGAAAMSADVNIPYAALLDDGGRSYVFVVRGGVAHRRDVLPGSGAGDRIAIAKGLAAGERVVVEGGTALEDGMKVRESAAQ